VPSIEPGDSESPCKTNPALAAALIGGTAVATAGAIWSARAIARRNGARDAQGLSPVMRTAVTASELAHSPAAERPAA
jgi:hypothetical protein